MYLQTNSNSSSEKMLEKIEDFSEESDNEKEEKLANFLSRMDSKVKEVSNWCKLSCRL